MKKLQLSIATLTSIFYLASCSAAGTQVRLLELSYSLPGSQTEAARLNEKNLPTKKNADSSEYIFPGDILTFTVKLEDPTFEFISLLAIKFNGVTIRANTNDSIVTTSDCGANICVNFPFEVSADVTEYTVEEVKFAKLSSESGIDAIIDNQSQNSLTLDIYTDEVFPSVYDSVEFLNQHFQSIEYFDMTAEEFNDAIPILDRLAIYHSRMLSILFLEDSPSTIDGTFMIDDDDFYYSQEFSHYFIINGNITLKNDGYPEYHFHNEAFHISYKNNIYVTNEKNKIYIYFKGNKYFLIEMGRRTQFINTPVTLDYFIKLNGYLN